MSEIEIVGAPQTNVVESHIARESKHCVTNGLRNIHFRWGAGLDIRSATDLAGLTAGRNFLPLSLGDSAGAGASPAAVPEAAFLTLRCHFDRFSAA